MTSTPLTAGATAPEFTLNDQFGQQVSLRELRDHKAVLVVFYPFAFSGICTGELRGIAASLEDFQNDRVQVVGISCDPMFAQRAWADDEGYTFPLLSDFWPHGAVARDYGVFHEEGGMAIRGTFLIDQEGIVRWSLVHQPGEARDFGGVQEALDHL